MPDDSNMAQRWDVVAFGECLRGYQYAMSRQQSEGTDLLCSSSRLEANDYITVVRSFNRVKLTSGLDARQLNEC